MLLFHNNNIIIKTQHVNLSKSYLRPLCGMSATCQLCGSATCATVIGLKSIMLAFHDAVWREPALKAQHGHPGPVQTASTVGTGPHSTAGVCEETISPLTQSLHFEDCLRVRRLDVTMGLWVSRHVGFRGITLPMEIWRPFSQSHDVTAMVWLCSKKLHNCSVWIKMDWPLTVG